MKRPAAKAIVTSRDPVEKAVMFSPALLVITKLGRTVLLKTSLRTYL